MLDNFILIFKVRKFNEKLIKNIINKSLLIKINHLLTFMKFWEIIPLICLK